MLSLYVKNHDNIIKRLSEATELLSETPQAEAWGFGIITALRAAKSIAKIRTSN